MYGSRELLSSTKQIRIQNPHQTAVEMDDARTIHVKAHKVGAISLTFNYELGWIEPIADNPLALPGVCEW